MISRVKFLPIAWAGMPKTIFRKNSDSLYEVGMGIIPDNALARQFVDVSGKAAQLMGRYCDRVFFCSTGLMMPMK